MKKIHTFLLCCMVLLYAPMDAFAAPQAQTSGIRWETNYEKAVEQSKATSRPIVLFFTGSDWCGWCNKLEKEVFDTREFAQATSNKLIFVKLDFPMQTKLDPNLEKQNKKLQETFAVRSYPTVILLDPNQQPIGVTGYRSGGGTQYAQHLIKMVNEYTAYKQQMRQIGAQKYSGKELKRLYQKAHELGLQEDANIIIRQGMESDLASFFLTERYRYLANHGQIESKETAALKMRLFASDPDNKHLTRYQVALIDFESKSNEMEETGLSPETVIAPLVDYIASYGAEDRDNLWRLNMVISQVYLDNNCLSEALKFAEASYAAAPPPIQPDIATAIKNIQNQIAETR